MAEGSVDIGRPHVLKDIKKQPLKKRKPHVKPLNQPPLHSVAVPAIPSAIGAVAVGLSGLAGSSADTQTTAPPIEEVTTREQRSSTVETTKHTYTNLLTMKPEKHEAARKLINIQRSAVERIATLPVIGERGSLKVVKEWKDKIVAEALNNNLSPPVSMAIALIENRGGVESVSTEGATGIYQLLEGAARQTGVMYEKHGKTIDQRKNPVANIEGGNEYLALQKDYFGKDRLDFGVLSYYAGYGTVVRLLGVHSGNTLPTVEQAAEDFDARELIRKYIKENSLTVYDLLYDKKVNAFIEEDWKKLKEDRVIPPAIFEYVPRVAAAAEYLVENGIIEPETVALNIPIPQPSYPAKRTDGAVV